MVIFTDGNYRACAACLPLPNALAPYVNAVLLFLIIIEMKS